MACAMNVPVESVGQAFDKLQEKCGRCGQPFTLGMSRHHHGAYADVCHGCHVDIEEEEAEAEEAGGYEMDQTFSMIDCANAMLRTMGALECGHL